MYGFGFSGAVTAYQEDLKVNFIFILHFTSYFITVNNLNWSFGNTVHKFLFKFYAFFSLLISFSVSIALCLFGNSLLNYLLTCSLEHLKLPFDMSCKHLNFKDNFVGLTFVSAIMFCSVFLSIYCCWCWYWCWYCYCYWCVNKIVKIEVEGRPEKL